MQPEQKDKIVIREGTKVVSKRDEHIPLKKVETQQQTDKRHQITATETAQALAVKKEEMETLKEEQRKEIHFKKMESEKKNNADLARGVNENNLHPQGYSGTKVYHV